MLEAVGKVEIVLWAEQVDERVGSFDDAAQNDTTGQSGHRKHPFIDYSNRSILIFFPFLQLDAPHLIDPAFLLASGILYCGFFVHINAVM